MSHHPDFEKWQELATKLLKGKAARLSEWQTPEGIRVKPLYTAEDIEGTRKHQHPARPGSLCPGTDGNHVCRPPLDHQAVCRFLHRPGVQQVLPQSPGRGQKGLSVAFDLATHRGYDSDHPRVTGDVGKAGVAIDSVEDMKILFDGIPLDQMSVSMTMNGAVIPILASYIVAAEEQGVSHEQLTGTIQNDILKGVPDQKHLHLSADPVYADCLRYYRLLFEEHAALQHHQHQRLSHDGGRRQLGTAGRLYHGGWPGVRKNGA
jgi:methylmalonyl-CoA mutase